ncbi:MAG: hypothetical protein WKF61_00650 [Luteimonas sp.]
MSTATYIHREAGTRVRIACSDDEPCIWIRTQDATIALDLSPAQRNELRAALDMADTFNEEAA